MALRFRMVYLLGRPGAYSDAFAKLRDARTNSGRVEKEHSKPSRFVPGFARWCMLVANAALPILAPAQPPHPRETLGAYREKLLGKPRSWIKVVPGRTLSGFGDFGFSDV